MDIRKTLTALAALCMAVLLSASGCFDDAVKGGGSLVKGAGDDVLKSGTQRADEVLLRVPPAIRPTLGARLNEGVARLSSDSQVQEALQGMAWETTCALVFRNVLANADSVATFLVERAIGFGIQFLDDGAQQMAEMILEAYGEQPSEAEEACVSIGEL